MGEPEPGGRRPAKQKLRRPQGAGIGPKLCPGPMDRSDEMSRALGRNRIGDISKARRSRIGPPELGLLGVPSKSARHFRRWGLGIPAPKTEKSISVWRTVELSGKVVTEQETLVWVLLAGGLLRAQNSGAGALGLIPIAIE